MSNIVNTLDLFIQSGGAQSGPPLGTILGHLGLNTTRFCKEFNDFTQKLPFYFNIRVRLFVYDNRSFSFVVFRPSTSYILSLLKLDRMIPTKTNVGIKNFAYEGVPVLELLKLTLFVFPRYNLNNFFKIC